MVLPLSDLICCTVAMLLCHPCVSGPIDLVGERCPGAPVDLFVTAAPPRRCPLLVDVEGHRRARCGNGEAERIVDN